MKTFNIVVSVPFTEGGKNNKQLLQAAFKEGIIYSETEWKRIVAPPENYYYTTLTVNEKFEFVENPLV